MHKRKQSTFKLRKTAAYGLISCMFATSLAIAPTISHAQEPTAVTTEQNLDKNVIIRVTDTTTNTTNDFNVTSRVGDTIDVPEIITIMYPLSQYHANFNQQYTTHEGDNIWNITVEKYAENPYEILPEEVENVIRTIHITYPDNTTDTIVQTAQKYRARRKVIATGEIQVSPWRFPPQTSYWEDFTTKTINGYQPNIAYVEAQGEPAKNETINIHYEATTQKVSGIIRYMDKGNVVSTQTITGIKGKTTHVKLNVPKNYNAELSELNVDLNENNQTFDVNLTHQTIDMKNEERERTRYIILTYPDATKETFTQISKQSRSRVQDLVTGEIIPTSDWVFESGWDEFVFPVIKGYSLPITKLSEEMMPTYDSVESYTYNPDLIFVTILYKTTNGDLVQSQEIGGTINTTKEQELTIPEGYTSEVSKLTLNFKDNYNDLNRTVIVKAINNQNESIDVESHESKPTETSTTPNESTDNKNVDTKESATSPDKTVKNKDENNHSSTKVPSNETAEQPNNEPVENLTDTTTEPSNDSNTTVDINNANDTNDNELIKQPQTTNNNTEKATDTESKFDENHFTQTETTSEPKTNDNQEVSNDEKTQSEESDVDVKYTKEKQNNDTNTNNNIKLTKSHNQSKEKTNIKVNNTNKTSDNQLPKAGVVENAWLAALGMGSIVSALGVAEINRRKN